MQSSIETKTRSIIKAISWRFLATLTTSAIVYAFFGRLDLAAAIGVIESSSKIFLYFLHERLWLRIKWGKKEVTPFVLWFTGLPLSGKTTIADMVYKELKQIGIKVERLDSKQVRQLFPKAGYTREDRIRHLGRVAFLASMLEKNGISVVASFITPYKEARDFARKLCKNYVEIYVKASIETCMKRDYKGIYEKALKGEIPNFTGISDPYEEPENPDIIIDTEKLTPEEAKNIVVGYVKKRFLR